MTHFFNRPLNILVASAVLLSSTACFANEEKVKASEKNFSRTTVELLSNLNQMHYKKQPIDDVFSEHLLAAYLEQIDPNKRIFLQSDINEFQGFSHKLDDEFKQGNSQSAFIIHERYQTRIENRYEFIIALFKENKFDFTIDESIPLERKSWPSTQKDSDEYWRKLAKTSIIENILGDDETTQEKVAADLLERYENYLSQIKLTKQEDIFEKYLNAVGSLFDPHTSYFTPISEEDFNIDMSLSLTGIGAELSLDKNITTIKRLIENGPAQKGGLLQEEDQIIAVAQGNKEFVNIMGMRLDDVVQLIRGEVDTTVRLKVRKLGNADNQKIVPIVRKVVTLEDKATKHEVKEVTLNGKTLKVGVISVPSFYYDFEAARRGDENFKSTTFDVAKILAQYKKDGIDAVIMDVRNNGGGALSEAIALSGLFIKDGPIVQVKYSNGHIAVNNDEDPAIAWDGPLAVMTNRLSASASEIFAGAIKDYNRGLVIGDTTYGKGTVQTLKAVTFGQIKLTFAMFYRVSGMSTQHRGVEPHLFLNSYIKHDKIGESSLDNALPFNQISAPEIEALNIITPELVEKLTLVQQQEFAANENWQATFSAILKERAEQETLSLNLETRKKQSQMRKTQREAILKDLDLEEDSSLYDYANDINLNQTLNVVAHWLAEQK
ncbi:carboxy terminal-processing peptidase [Marinicellulosiphila megalodicopiae]|uniref:carboxy terminal-processing peptidase n=1 Tax=Marinicellulosiphila megalodicopiae TaxID=2724896 RepID=UPI003BAFBEE5